MEWHSILINTKEDAIELIADMLYSIGVKGIEIVDNKLSQYEKENLIVDYIDSKLVVSDSIKVICYFSEEENIEEKVLLIEEYLEEIKGYVDIGEGTINRSITKEEDWANNWKQYYKPFRVGEHIVIKPTWEPFLDLKEDDIVIEIDPGMAFGCGTHETTSMCITQLEKYVQKGVSVIDVGCGSGILSIVAARLGAGKISAIDLDKAAVKVSKENVELNHLEAQISVFHGDLISQVNEKADLVVANIMADIILVLVDDIKRVLKNDGLFISSGIILDRLDEVKSKLISSNFEIIEITNHGEWVAITSKMKA
ncbi:MAG: 50S ribosomal protein L11 methyltransferase [Firmicutes bacterium HGW-Firmicutes-1]|jgi:ribosomal protein L11 methyltransferase|nr:MAG: 50S ribosomal protein L11 methyltransferase [Firmicutes bacterium HGW-Firmicutes-1]